MSPLLRELLVHRRLERERLVESDEYLSVERHGPRSNREFLCTVREVLGMDPRPSMFVKDGAL